MSIIKWKRNEIEKLIVCVQQKSCLYDVKSWEYLDRTKKALAFNDVLLEMQKGIPNVTLTELKRKWRNLRTQYTQELRTLNLAKKSGYERIGSDVPKLWCFDQLSFLKTHVQFKASQENTQDRTAVWKKRNSRNHIRTNSSFKKLNTENLDYDVNNPLNPPNNETQDDEAVKNIIVEEPLFEEIKYEMMDSEEPLTTTSTGEEQPRNHAEENYLEYFKKRKLELELEKMELENYKLKLEILEVEKKLNIPLSQYTENIRNSYIV